MNNIYLIIATVVALISTACTKEKPYDELPKLNTQLKINGDPNALYLMTITTEGSSINAPVIPYEVSGGDEVALEFTENFLQVMRVPRDFKDNRQNRKLLVTVPVDYVDYQCAKDSYGKCTNVEEEVTDKPWDQKKYYKPTYKDVKIEGAVGLSVYRANYFQSCYEAGPSTVVSFQNEEGYMNIVTETPWKTASKCASFENFSDWADLSFTTRQTISIVRKDKVVSPDYQPLENDIAGVDINNQAVQFGLWWGDIIQKYDPSNIQCQKGDCQIQYAKRWNPTKTKITYYLTKNFARPENANLVEATDKAFHILNQALEEAGANFRIENKGVQPDKIEIDGKMVDFIAGDLRHSMISLVEDPVTMGLLGYGPSISNSETGEIISARNVMFKGVMKKTIAGAYNDLINFKRKRVATGESGSTGSNSRGQTVGQNAQSQFGANRNVNFVELAKSKKLEKFMKFPKMVKSFSTTEVVKKASLKSDNEDPISKIIPYDNLVNFDALTSENNRLSRLVTKNRNLNVTLTPTELDLFENSDFANAEKQMEWLTAHNYYPSELFNLHKTAEGQLEKLVNDIHQGSNVYKEWSQLDETTQEKVVQVLLPILWIPTFVHEVGHNLGLRHNFAGSNDLDNFYSKEELAAKGIDKAITYSSIMDYAYGTVNELSVMGKYDVAALKWAYAKTGAKDPTTGKETFGAVDAVTPNGIKQVDRVRAKMLSQLGTIKLLPFKYCTDDSVANDPECNRFDEGTDILEITDHYINSYYDNYERTNFRNNKANFNNIWGDLSYISRIRGSLENLRVIFERYELDAEDMRTPEDYLTSQNQEAIMRLIAVHKIADFLLDIIKTPDAMCAIAPKDDPRTAENESLSDQISLFPLARAPFFQTCKEIQRFLDPNVRVVGQVGKSFRDIKSLNNPDSWAAAIDTRGIWIDKLAAIRILLERKPDSVLDDTRDLNFADIPDFSMFGLGNVRQEIYSTLTNVITDQLAGTVKVNASHEYVAEDMVGIAQDREIDIPYSLMDEQSHKIKPPYHPLTAVLMGVDPKKGNFFNEVVVDYVKRFALSDLRRVDSTAFREMFSIAELPVLSPYNESVVTNKRVLGNNIYLATANNTVANSVMNIITLRDAFTHFMKAPQGWEDRTTYYQQVRSRLLIKYLQKAVDIIESNGSHTEMSFDPNEPDLRILVSHVLAPELPASTPDKVRKSVRQQNLNDVVALLRGQTNDDEYYFQVIQALAREKEAGWVINILMDKF